MNPVATADMYRKRRLSANEAILWFVACSKDCSTENIVKEIPEALREGFEAYVLNSSGDDPTIGMGGLVLKKEWFDGFKSYYKSRST